MPIIDELVTILGFKADTSDGEKFESMLGSIKTAAMAAGTAIIGASAAVGIFTNRTAQALSETGRFAESVGVPVDRLQEFEFAVGQAGGSVQDLRGDLKSITQALASPIPGEFNQGLFLLGINVRDAAGQLKSADQILLEVSDRFQGLSSQQRQILSTQVGLSESTLRLVAQGRAEVEASAAAARKLGAVIDPGDIKAAIEYERRLGQVKTVFSGIAKTLSISLLPGINNFLKSSVEWFQANRLIISQNLESVVRGIASGIRFLAEKAGELGSFLSSKLGINFEDLTGKIDLAEIAFNATVAAVGALVVAFSPLIAKFALIAAAATGVYLVIEDLIVAFRGGKSVSGQLFNDLLEKFPIVKQAFEDVKNVTIGLFNSFAESEQLAAFVEFFKEKTASIRETIGILVEAFVVGFARLATILSSWLSDTDAVVAGFFEIISPITSFLEAQINLWLGIFRSFALLLSGDVGGAIDNLKTTFTEFGANIKQLAMDILQSWVVLGENLLSAINIDSVSEAFLSLLSFVGEQTGQIGVKFNESIGSAIAIIGEKVGQIVVTLNESIGSLIASIGGKTGEIGAKLSESIVSVVAMIGEQVGEIGEVVINEIVEIASGIEQFIVDTFTGVVDRVVVAIKDAASAAKGSLSELVTNIPGIDLLTGGEKIAEPARSPSELLARNLALAQNRANVPLPVAASGPVNNVRNGGQVSQSNIFNISGAGSPALVANRIAGIQGGNLNQALQVAGAGVIE